VSLIARSYYGGLRAAGVPAVRRRLKDAGLILCYHNVVESSHGAGCPGLHEGRERFTRQMLWLDAHYDVIGLREFTERLTSGGSLRSVAAVTFDDGYAGVFEHAVPVVRALRLPATVFLVAEAVGRSAPFPWDGAAVHRAADWDQIRAALGDGIEVGVHSGTHPSLPRLTDLELAREIVASRAILRDATGVSPQFFAYPFGDWDARVRDFVRAAGYVGALTLDFGLNDGSVDRWALRRVNVPAGISDAAFEAWASGCHGLSTH
jgi:peptidoglycan/xylan/chitin deacetylase (PgdA/CDA1 family)